MSSSPPQALADRIADAIARIEKAGVRPAAPASGSGQLPELQTRHANLRRETVTALAELDALIAGEAG